MKRIKNVAIALVLALAVFVISVPIEAFAEEETKWLLPESIETVSDLVIYLDYACANGTYGHTNSDSSVKDMDCSGLIKYIYSKMGYTGSAWDIVAQGEVVTRLSDAHIGDIVVYKKPGTNKITHFAILLDPMTGELVQSNGYKVGCTSMTLSNPKDWSNLVGMRVDWPAPYTNWNWGSGDESAHPEAIYIVHLVDIED